VSPSEQKAFAQLKAEVKACQRAMSAKDEEIATLKKRVDVEWRAAFENSRGSLERWIRTRKGSVTVHVSALARPVEIGLSITHGKAEIHGEGLTLDDAFEDGVRRAVRAINASAAKEIADLG